MQKDIWPFLVSCNKQKDYQSVVVPDFIARAKVPSLMVNWTSVTGTSTGNLIYKIIKRSPVGTVSLIYRVVKAENKQTRYRDHVGRPILWVEGVIVKGTIKKEKITTNVLKQSFQFVEESYQAFWANGQITVSKPLTEYEVISEPKSANWQIITSIAFSIASIILLPILIGLLILLGFGAPLGVGLPPFGFVLICLVIDIICAVVSIAYVMKNYRK